MVVLELYGLYWAGIDRLGSKAVHAPKLVAATVASDVTPEMKVTSDSRPGGVTGAAKDGA